MAKSRAEMMELVGRLLAEYAEFQCLRPDLPQGDLADLSEEELESLVAESATGRLKQTPRVWVSDAYTRLSTRTDSDDHAASHPSRHRSCFCRSRPFCRRQVGPVHPSRPYFAT